MGKHQNCAIRFFAIFVNNLMIGMFKANLFLCQITILYILVYAICDKKQCDCCIEYVGNEYCTFHFDKIVCLFFCSDAL